MAELVGTPNVPTVEELYQLLAETEDVATAIAVYKDAKHAADQHVAAYEGIRTYAKEVINANLRDTGEAHVKMLTGSAGYMKRNVFDEARFLEDVEHDEALANTIHRLEATIAAGKAAEKRLKSLKDEYKVEQRTEELFIR